MPKRICRRFCLFVRYPSMAERFISLAKVLSRESAVDLRYDAPRVADDRVEACFCRSIQMLRCIA